MYPRRVHGAGYPRVVGYVAGEHVPGFGVVGEEPPPPMLPVGHYGHPGPVHGHPIHAPPWRAMNAPGSPPLGEGHVPLPLNPESFSGAWGGTGTAFAPSGTQLTFSARPQKPFKTSRLLVNATKVGTSAVGRLQGQVYVGTDLQQGELGNLDLESIGAANAFDTWVSFKQAEPGVWIRVQAGLSAYPSGTDFEQYNIMAIGHFLH